MSVIGIVAIGRNEGDRFVRCLRSITGRATAIVYVDSGSTDDSVRVATEGGATVVSLDLSKPFTAARARNEGAHRLLELAPDVTAIQFLDGDCELDPDWLERAVSELDARPDVAVVCGRRKETFPDRSIYNRLCDIEWDTPVGEAEACGGDALFRRSAFEAAGGYDQSLIAGEEPELCARLRATGWKVLRIPAAMTTHDAAMSRFGQWWRRATRAGYAYAEVAARHGRTGLKSWRRQVFSNWFWAVVLPLAAVAGTFSSIWVSLAFVALYMAFAARIYVRSRRRFGPADARLVTAFSVLAKFPLALGQIQYYWSRMTGRTQKIIEYKGSAGPAGERVGYLVNQYPSVSHSFIRREIAGVEAAGWSVCRYTVRRPTSALVDDDDRKEQSHTKVILDHGLVRLALACATTALTRPIRWVRTARIALRLGSKSGRRLREFVYFTEACLLRRWLARDGVTHLHAHFGTNPTDVALLCHSLGGPTYSFTVHGPEEFDRPDALSLGVKIAHSRFVVAISSFGRSQLFRWCTAADWPKVHIVRCGVDAAFLDRGPLPPVAAPRIVCVGRLCEQKGQLLLIDAAARVAAAGVPFELVLAGDGPMRPEIEATIAAHGLGNRVRISGWLSNEAVRDELAAARIMALPSFAEGLPVVIMEALALGRPVVTTYVAGIPELVRDGINGWLVPAGNVDALAASLILALATGPDELAAMGRAGAEAVRQAHDAMAEGAKIAALFSHSAV